MEKNMNTERYEIIKVGGWSLFTQQPHKDFTWRTILYRMWEWV